MAIIKLDISTPGMIYASYVNPFITLLACLCNISSHCCLGNGGIRIYYMHSDQEYEDTMCFNYLVIGSLLYNM